MAAVDALSEAADLVRKHLAGLDEERGQLTRALAELNGDATIVKAKPTRRPERPKGRKTRARRGGTRAVEAVKLIADKPGISATEIAKKMKIKPNYLYRVLGDLEKEGQVKKDGRKYSPAG